MQIRCSSENTFLVQTPSSLQYSRLSFAAVVFTLRFSSKQHIPVVLLCSVREEPFQKQVTELVLQNSDHGVHWFELCFYYPRALILCAHIINNDTVKSLGFPARSQRGWSSACPQLWSEKLWTENCPKPEDVDSSVLRSIYCP